MNKAEIEARQGKLEDKLRNCPCCKAGQRDENTPADGIPEGMAVEFVYDCGAAVFITDKAGAETSRACPGPMDKKLSGIEDVLDDELREDDDDTEE